MIMIPWDLEGFVEGVQYMVFSRGPVEDIAPNAAILAEMALHSPSILCGWTVSSLLFTIKLYIVSDTQIMQTLGSFVLDR